jgi:hypothetical protein
MPGGSKSTRAAPVETSSASNQLLDALHRFREMRHGVLENGGAQCQLQSRPVETILNVGWFAVVSVTSSIEKCGFGRKQMPPASVQ